MTRSQWVKRLADLMRELARAEAAVERASARRRDLPPGSTRARVTTANARWMQAAEERDRIKEELDELGVTIPQCAPAEG